MNPALFGNLFFLFWGGLSYFGFGGLREISNYTLGLVFTCFLAYTLGVFFSTPRNPKLRLSKEISLNSIYSYFKLLLVLQYLIYSVLVVLWFKIIRDIPNIQNYRLQAYGNLDSPSLLFGDQKLALLYWIFCYAFNHVLLYLGVFLYFKTGKKIYILLGWLPILFDSVVFMGRGAFVELAHVSTFIVLVKLRYYSKGLLGLIGRNKKLFILALIVPFLVAFASKMRGDVDQVNIEFLVRDQLINYNTVGFVILDDELQSPASYLNMTSSWPGRTTFGGLENLVYLVYSRFDRSIVSLTGNVNEYLQKFEKNLGGGEEQKYYNAFCTSIYHTYLDGGVLWSITYFFIYGFILSSLFRKIRMNLFYIVFALPLFQNMLTSVYKSMLGDMGFVACLLILVFIYRTTPFSTSSRC